MQDHVAAPLDALPSVQVRLCDSVLALGQLPSSAQSLHGVRLRDVHGSTVTVPGVLPVQQVPAAAPQQGSVMPQVPIIGVTIG